MKIENDTASGADYYLMRQDGTVPGHSLSYKKSEIENIVAAPLKYGGENSSGVNLATRMYADRVIKNALQNIKLGENVYENKRIIEIFGHIVGENSNKIIYG